MPRAESRDVMETTDDEFFGKVIEVVARYGMRRTTMADLAREGGVSRQTLYDRFGDKDGVMTAAIRHMGERLLADLSEAFSRFPNLDRKIEAYADIAIWPMFELIRSLPDAADFEKGMGVASTAAVDEISKRKRAILAGMLRSHLPPTAPKPEQVARFFEEAATRAKMSDMSRDDFAEFLDTLKASVVALSRD